MFQDDIENLAQRLTSRGAPYHVEKVPSPDGDLSCYVFGPKTLERIASSIGTRGAKPFIIVEDRTWTYEEIAENARIVAAVLEKEYFVSRGQRILLATDEVVDWVSGFFATLLIGAVPVLFRSPEYSALDDCLRTINPALAIADSSGQEALRTCSFGKDVIDLSAVLREKGKTWRHSVYDPICNLEDCSDQEALITFTSGSSGRPKAVVQSHRSVITGLMNMMYCAVLSRPPVGISKPSGAQPLPLICCPLAYIGGYAHILLTALHGGRVSVATDKSPKAKMIRDFGITSVVAADNDCMFKIIKDAGCQEQLSSMRSWFVAGTAMNENLVRAVMEKCPQITLYSGYGLTETNGGICSASWQHVQASHGLLGRLAPTVEVRIINQSGDVLQPGEVGDIHLRGPMLTMGYLGASNRLTGLDGGWLNTGDVGYVTGNRELSVIDRRSQLIEIGNRTLSIAEVERFVLKHYGITDACLVKLDKDNHDCGYGIALMRDDAFQMDLDGLTLAVERQFKLKVKPCPYPVFPRTSSGKIDRNTLTARVRALLRNNADVQH